MRKVVVILTALFALGTMVATAAPAKATGKITNTKVVRATKDTTLSYGGLNVFVPADQTVILGQTANGSIVVRGQNIQGVKIGEGTVSAKGFVTLSVAPQTNVITVVTGNGVQVTDANGRTAELAQGASVSGQDIRLETVPTLDTTATNTVAQADETVSALPAFVASMESTNAATEQATQDVEETLSPSAPR